MVSDSTKSWPELEVARKALLEGDGRGVKVAIIDSGIDVRHPALKGVTLEDDITVSCDGINLHIAEGKGIDVYGHGTAVASLVLREAPGVTLGSFRALDTSNQARSFVFAEGFNQAISRGYQIINCSFGCRGLPRYVMEYKEWVDRAYLEGVQVVAACSNIDGGIREWPAYFPSVISVRGIDCPPGALYFHPGRLVSFLAAGERVEVPWLNGAMKLETGSSYAAPLVVGKIARLISELPALERSAIKPLLSILAERQP